MSTNNICFMKKKLLIWICLLPRILLAYHRKKLYFCDLDIKVKEQGSACNRVLGSLLTMLKGWILQKQVIQG